MVPMRKMERFLGVVGQERSGDTASFFLSEPSMISSQPERFLLNATGKLQHAVQQRPYECTATNYTKYREEEEKNTRYVAAAAVTGDKRQKIVVNMKSRIY